MPHLPHPPPAVEWSSGDAQRRQNSTRWDEAEIWELVTRQHGVVERAQLIALDVPARTIDRWIATGRLRVLHPRVYAVGHGRLTIRGWWMAAVLAGGEGAVLSHRCCAAVRGLIRWEPRRPSISIPASRRIHLPGVAVHRIQVLEPDTVDEIPCSSVARVILDMAAISGWRQLEKIVEEADLLGLYDQRQMDDLLARVARPRGVRLLRAVLAAHDPNVRTFTRSNLEETMLRLCDRGGLPRPVVNGGLQLLDGTWTEVDFHWPGPRVAVETHGDRFHSSRPKRRRDSAKLRALQLAGWLALPVHEDDLADRPDSVLAEIRLALARRVES